MSPCLSLHRHSPHRGWRPFPALLGRPRASPAPRVCSDRARGGSSLCSAGWSSPSKRQSSADFHRVETPFPGAAYLRLRPAGQHAPRLLLLSPRSPSPALRRQSPSPVLTINRHRPRSAHCPSTGRAGSGTSPLATAPSGPQLRHERGFLSPTAPQIQLEAFLPELERISEP